MYNAQQLKTRCLIRGSGLLIASSQVFSGSTEVGFDTGIADYLNKVIATREQDSYLKRSYDANFSADPF
ncbi:MAG: hypothetical protein LBU27_08290 [Candidatus Peribacteria bacterium]|nr:hypothetical protein [Candidatus Peribacteria bacterium]